MRRLLKVGDTIKCADKEDLLNTYNDLALNGVYTDFLYEKDGKTIRELYKGVIP